MCVHVRKEHLNNDLQGYLIILHEPGMLRGYYIKFYFVIIAMLSDKKIDITMYPSIDIA